MIIDETFMWLYATYKIGEAFIAPALISALASLVMIPISIETESGINVALKVWKISAFVLPISLFIVVLTPSSTDVKAYAAYAIGKDVATSAEAKRLYDAAINYIEGKVTQK